MKTLRRPLPLLCLWLTACGGTVALAQDVFLAGQIEVSQDDYARATTTYGGLGMVGDGTVSLLPFENPVFSCTPVRPLKSGDVLAAKVSNAHSQSVDNVPLNNIPYPILFMSAGAASYPAVVKLKVALKAGQVINSGGYEIKVTRAVTAGESIPVLVVGGKWTWKSKSVLSESTAQGATEPWFTAFDESKKSDFRADAMKLWQMEQSYVRHRP